MTDLQKIAITHAIDLLNRAQGAANAALGNPLAGDVSSVRRMEKNMAEAKVWLVALVEQK